MLLKINILCQLLKNNFILYEKKSKNMVTNLRLFVLTSSFVISANRFHRLILIRDRKLKPLSVTQFGTDGASL